MGGKKSNDAAQRSADPGRAGPRAGAELDPNEGQQEAPEPLAHKCNGKNKTANTKLLVYSSN